MDLTSSIIYLFVCSCMYVCITILIKEREAMIWEEQEAYEKGLMEEGETDITIFKL